MKTKKEKENKFYFTMAMLILALLVLNGCASQNFSEVIKSWHLNGQLESMSKTKGSNKTVSLPFDSRTSANHSLRLTQHNVDSWDIVMGTTAEVHGGNIEPLVDTIVETTVESVNPLSSISGFMFRE